MPWSTLFPELFSKEYGYSLTDNLPLLYFDIDKAEKFRSDFYNMAAKPHRTYYLLNITYYFPKIPLPIIF